VSTLVPSGENATECTQPVCPVKVRSSAPVAAAESSSPPASSPRAVFQ